jgi:predicted nucleotidyltransferase
MDTFDETSDIDLDAREFGWLLSDLALAMQKNDRTLAARWWINDRILDCLQGKLGFALEEAKDASDRIIRYLTERTGLLEERGLDQFGFSHRTIQEYFAATGAIDEADASTTRDINDRLRGYLYHPQWSEVIRLVAAQQTPGVAESLISSILDDPDPVGRFLKRGPLLALRCLSDGATVPNRRLVTSIFESVADLGRSKWLGITLEAFDVLQAFGGTRLEKTATETVESILRTAKQELDGDEYAFLYQHARWSEIFEQAEQQHSSDLESDAAREVKVEIEGRSYAIIFFNGSLRMEKPEIWFESICLLLQDDRKSLLFREFLVRELGRQVETDPRSRRALQKVLRASTMPSSLRSACAWALATGARTRDSRLLLQVLQREKDTELRAACAAALKHVACSDRSVRGQLLEILNSTDAIDLRAGAARGLQKVAGEDQETTAALLDLADKDEVPDDLRSTCAWALEKQIGRVSEIADSFKGWIDAAKDTKLRVVAAQALAHAMADEELPWDYQVVEKIEHVLMKLDDPCSHALGSLEALATAREVRRGLRLESVLHDALKPLADRIELSFIFGSTARRRQTEDSDIDLMIIGNATLKDLASPLRNAEKTLGRRVNPALYTRDSFQQKYQSGDPFLVDVYRREKVPVIPPDASRRELDDELRAMVAERLASTG